MKLTKPIINKLYNFFTSEMGMVEYHKGWLKGDCPNCGRVGKFGIQLFQNRSNCFVCGYHEKPLNIALEKTGLLTLNAFISRDINTFTQEYKFQEELKPLEENKINLPEGFKLITNADSFMGQLAQKQMIHRGFKLLDLAMLGIGYCTKGKYKNRIIIPYFENGQLVYFNARRMLAEGPKFQNPTADELGGIGKSLLIYNIDSLYIYNRIYIVESAINAITLGPQAIALGGKIISNYQLTKIIKSPCTQVVILLDDDAYNYAIELGLKLSLHKKVKIVLMPKGKDVNDIGRKATLKLVKQENFLTYGMLLRKQKDIDLIWEK